MIHMEKISFAAVRIKEDKKLHSREHVLADDLSREMREPGRFGAYLGIATRYHESDLRALARRVREKEGLPPDARGKYFFVALRGLMPVYAPKKKKRKKLTTRNAKRKSDRAARHRKRAA